jgi:hypothetical protein
VSQRRTTRGTPEFAISSSVGMPAKAGGGKGEAWLAGLELAERLPRKIGAGGTMGSSSAGGCCTCCSGDDGVLSALLSDGATGLLVVLMMEGTLQLLSDDMIWANPFGDPSGRTWATSVSGVFWACGNAQLFLPRSIFGRGEEV